MLCCAGAPINCRRSPSLGGEWAAKQDALLPLQCTEWKAGTVIPHALLSTAIAMPSLAAETSHSVSSIILAAGSVSAIFFLLSGVCWIKAASITVRDPHDADGIADHVGGALLASRSARHHDSSDTNAISSRLRASRASCETVAASKSLTQKSAARRRMA